MKTEDFQADYSLLLFAGERQRSTNYTGENKVKIWMCGNCRVNVVNKNLSTFVHVLVFSGGLKIPLRNYMVFHFKVSWPCHLCVLQTEGQNRRSWHGSKYKLSKKMQPL